MIGLRRYAGLRAHPLASLFPAPTEAEYAELLGDVRARGQRVKIVLLGGKIIDGRSRARACEDLGLAPQTEEYAGEDPLGEVLSLNLHRRSLNAGQRRDVVRQVLRSDPSRSDRFVAGKTGVSDKTVGRIRDELESGAEIPHLDDVKGSDGKSYRATRAKPPKPDDSDWPARAAAELGELIAHMGRVVVPIQQLLKGRGRGLVADPDAIVEGLGRAVAEIREARDALAGG